MPKSPAGNRAYRQKWWKRGQSSKAEAQGLWAACARDPLFYINTFVFTLDPRLRHPTVPFITYPFQDEAICNLIAGMGFFWPDISPHDMLIEKTRDMGASWMCIMAMEWAWHFHRDRAFLMLSRKEEYVDKSGDFKALLPKIDFVLARLPGFLRPRYDRIKLHFYNHENDSTIDGESTTGESGRGDRRTAILLDEFASVDEGQRVLAATQSATECRMFNSTPKGTGNAFYQMRETDIFKMRLHWTEHPVKSRGMYKAEDGKWRSPWYDNECKRTPSRLLIAQEIDIDYHASGGQFFDGVVLKALTEGTDDERTAMPYFHEGELVFEPEDGALVGSGWDERDGGRLKLWVHPDADGKVNASHDYIVGCDIAAGTDASNSALCVGDATTGEKVGEFADPRTPPHHLAHLAVALCNYFAGKNGPARLIWEANGHGRIFGDEVIRMGYRNVYYRRNDRSLSKKQSDTPGWYSTQENKLTLLGAYKQSLEDGSFKNRSELALKECHDYVFLSNSQVDHVATQNLEDPSGAKQNHGDRVIADALCSMLMKEAVVIEKADTPKAKPGSMAWRVKEQERELAEAALW